MIVVVEAMNLIKESDEMIHRKDKVRNLMAIP